MRAGPGTSQADQKPYSYVSAAASRQFQLRLSSPGATSSSSFESSISKIRAMKTCPWFSSSLFLLSVAAVLISGCLGAHDVEFKHHNNTDLASVLQRVHNKCPDITRLYTLSEPSVNGIPLYVLEISDMPGKHELRKSKNKYDYH